MSPASQGGLQVERYIGTCLISKSDAHSASYRNPYAAHHHHHGPPPHGAHPGAWAGLPLISMVQPRRNKQQQQQQPQQQPPPPQQQVQPQAATRSPLSRLAIHTQGAPLILAGRYGSRKHGGQGLGQGLGLQPGNNPQYPPGPPGTPSQNAGHPKNSNSPRPHRPLGPHLSGPMGGPCGPMSASGKPSASSDSLSVASDESSGHSENSLPRIIKPRKRRKKDRKPPQLGQAGDATPSAQAQSQAPAQQVPTVSLKSLGGGEVIRDAGEQGDEPKLHHDFDEVKEHDVADDPVLLCQCRYCDPAGLIWDVDQNCYSPFLTPQPQPQHLSSFPLFISDLPASTTTGLFQDLREQAAPCAPVGTRGPTDLLLRRSWSEPSPSRKHSESSDSQESDRRTPPSHQALEVSSEIVTSHNGHRDIEIKFFSLPATELDSSSKQ